jgi:hypothetical protein
MPFQISVEPLRSVYQKSTNGLYREVIEPVQDTRASLKLIDLDEDEVYSYEETQEKRFIMNDKGVRSFRWVLGDVSDEDRNQDISARITKSAKKEHTPSEDGTFGLPPQL